MTSRLRKARFHHAVKDLESSIVGSKVWEASKINYILYFDSQMDLSET
jgi:hypothetical protein